jgi:hypothetical protein
MASSEKKTAVLALMIALAAAAAWWGWNEHQRRALRGAVTALVQQASASVAEDLRDGLRPPADGSGVRKLEADAQALDGRLAALERVDAARERTLVYAADEYGLAARQVLRELAREQRQRRRVAESMKLLTDHMNRANRRAPDWYRNALGLKDELEKSYFDYKLAADALARELDALAGARARVADRLGRLADSALIDETLAADARRRADEAARRVADDMQRARRMAGGR